MKKNVFSFLILMLLTSMIISCNKNNDNSQQVEIKPYTWVAGAKDSTGYGMILFSADSGETWVRQGQGTAELQEIDVDDIWAIDANTVWAVCSRNVILKTIDGGKTWIRIQVPVAVNSARLSSISIANKTNIWISGSGGTVYNSKDNGNTWSVFDSNYFHKGIMQGVWAISPQKVYVAGGIGNSGKIRGFIAFTLNGGITWDTVFPSDDYNKHEWIGVTSFGNTIVVYGGKAHYIYSVDAGTTWKNDSIPGTGGIGGADINHLIMLDSQTWWGALDLSQIFLTTDGGTAWISQPAIMNGEFNFGIDAFNSQLALNVGELSGWSSQGSILKTSNGGISWKNIHTYHSSLYKVSFIRETQIFRSRVFGTEFGSMDLPWGSYP